MLIRGVNLLNSKLETECYLRYYMATEVVLICAVERKVAHDYVGTICEFVEASEPDVQVPLDEIEIDENLRFVEEPIEIVERDVKKLKRRRIPLVKVRWNSRQGAEYTWECEDQFRKKYPNLFSEPVLSSSAAT
ncbi:hypothetical protein Tco_1493478 [Tanacetum coccineum]